jgi:hypothetical protein
MKVKVFLLTMISALAGGIVMAQAIPQTPICTKTISFAIADRAGVHQSMTGWIQSWVEKNNKKHPDVCFSQMPLAGRENYTIVISRSTGAFVGLQPVTRTSTTVSNTPVSGGGTVMDDRGQMWSYTYSGTAMTTTTTTRTEAEQYEVDSNHLYATGYNAQGQAISQHQHVYSTRTGGDASTSFGYNMGNALASINSRGRLLNAVVSDIDKSRRGKAERN